MPRGLGRTSDFSPIASRYDATRDVPKSSLLRCYDRLIEAGALPASGTILDAGCGTGQMSLPLAERGYRVRGYDISKDMAALAQGKAQPEWQAEYGVADVRELPVAAGSCGAVVVSKLLMHVEEWQRACSEFIRVVRPGGFIIHIKDRGMFSNAVRLRFARRTDELGFTHRSPGQSPESNIEMMAYMTSRAVRRARRTCRISGGRSM